MYEATVCILQAVAFFAKKKPIRMVGAVEGASAAAAASCELLHLPLT